VYGKWNNMASEVYSSALKNALNEIQNICPQIKKSFIFRKDGEIIAGDKRTSEKTILRVVNALHDLLEKPQAIGNVEDVIIKGNKGRVDISCMNNLYLVTVTSKS
jgi:predicted regulator of Ras-like GTPase activity (Roadblock/LC7/MglB family)